MFKCGASRIIRNDEYGSNGPVRLTSPLNPSPSFLPHRVPLLPVPSLPDYDRERSPLLLQPQVNMGMRSKVLRVQCWGVVTMGECLGSQRRKVRVLVGQ